MKNEDSSTNEAKAQRREALRRQWLQEHPTRDRADDKDLPPPLSGTASSTEAQGDFNKIQEVYQKENIRRLQNAQRHAAASLEVGQSTTAALRQQGETLDTIELEQQDAQYEVKRGRRTVRGMASFGGKLKNWFTRRPHRPPPIATGTSSLCPAGATPEQQAAAAAAMNSSPSAAAANSNKNKKKKKDGAEGGDDDGLRGCRPEPQDEKKKQKNKRRGRKGTHGEDEQDEDDGLQQQQSLQKSSPERPAFGLSEKENQMLDILKHDVAQLRQESYNQQYVLQKHVEQLGRIQAQQDGLANEIVVTNEKIDQML